MNQLEFMFRTSRLYFSTWFDFMFRLSSTKGPARACSDSREDQNWNYSPRMLIRGHPSQPWREVYEERVWKTYMKNSIWKKTACQQTTMTTMKRKPEAYFRGNLLRKQPKVASLEGQLVKLWLRPKMYLDVYFVHSMKSWWPVERTLPSVLWWCNELFVLPASFQPNRICPELLTWRRSDDYSRSIRCTRGLGMGT